MHSLAVTRGATSEALHIQGNFASSSCYKGGLRAQFFCQLFRFWVSKMGSKKISSTPLKNIKQIKKKNIVETIAFQEKNDEEICAPKIDQHEANKKKHCKEHSVILHNIFRWVAATDGRVIYYLWSQVFARNLCFLFCQTIKVHPNPNALRMSPKSPLFKWIQFWASSISRATACLILSRHVQPINSSIKTISYMQLF